MKTFKWVVEFEVTENWVEDGFNITENRANDMIANALPYAYSSEYKATVFGLNLSKSARLRKVPNSIFNKSIGFI